MKYYMIQNDGEVEESAFTVMGLSSKDGQEKIGRFGTGNKYAIATALRNGIKVTVFSGEMKLEFDTEPMTHRGGNYDQVIVNGRLIGMVTRMGVDWKPWYIIREFVSNAMDEGGFIDDTCDESDVIGAPGTTRVFLSITPELQEVLKSMPDKILQEDHEVIFRGHKGELLEARGPHENIYRRGISVTGEAKNNSLYWYNFNEIQINEAREYMYSFHVEERMASILKECTIPSVVRNVLYHCTGKREWDADYIDSGGRFSEVWYEELRDKRICASSMSGILDNEARDTYIILPDNLVSALKSQWGDLNVYGSMIRQYIEIEPEKEHFNIVQEIVAKLSSIGFEFNVPIKFVKTVDQALMGLYDPESKMIGLSTKYMEDREELEMTIVEENFHAQGFVDGSRRYEQELIRQLIKARVKAAKWDQLMSESGRELI